MEKMQNEIEVVEKLCEVIDAQNQLIAELYKLLAQHEAVDEYSNV